MQFLKRLPQTVPAAVPPDPYIAFWTWFASKETAFRDAVQTREGIEERMFNPVAAQLNPIYPGILLLCGLHPDGDVELIFTADGAVRSIPFIEALIQAAPGLRGWRFTALKPPVPFPGFSIEMGGYSFSDTNIWFFPVSSQTEPDLIDITLVYADYNAEDHDLILNGCCILLDNYLGELSFNTQVDMLQVTGSCGDQPELIALGKLQDYLRWREKEFVERYDGVKYDNASDAYAVMEARTAEDLPVVALVNSTLLGWDGHASHPWILELRITYDTAERNGMPDERASAALDALGSRLLDALPETGGYLQMVRETGGNIRTLYYACREFRTPSVVSHQLSVMPPAGLTVRYEIYKDKYWRSFDRYRRAEE